MSVLLNLCSPCAHPMVTPVMASPNIRRLAGPVISLLRAGQSLLQTKMAAEFPTMQFVNELVPVLLGDH